jgi:hypothetical protein
MSSFTDQKPRVFTTEDSKAKWGIHGGRLFCTLCNHDFQVGDSWRWVFGNDGFIPSYGNFQVCAQCDGPDVLHRYQSACALLRESLNGRESAWPIDLAAQLIAAREQIAKLESDIEDSWYDQYYQERSYY